MAITSINIAINMNGNLANGNGNLHANNGNLRLVLSAMKKLLI